MVITVFDLLHFLDSRGSAIKRQITSYANACALKSEQKYLRHISSNSYRVVEIRIIFLKKQNSRNGGKTKTLASKTDKKLGTRFFFFAKFKYAKYSLYGV